MRARKVDATAPALVKLARETTNEDLGYRVTRCPHPLRHGGSARV